MVATARVEVGVVAASNVDDNSEEEKKQEERWIIRLCYIMYGLLTLPEAQRTHAIETIIPFSSGVTTCIAIAWDHIVLLY